MNRLRNRLPGRLPLASLLPVLVLALTACTQPRPPQVHEARIVRVPGMDMAAGYFRLENPGREPLRLVAVDSPDFGAVEMHESVVEQGISRMRSLAQAEVPARGELRFEPGGRHLMLFRSRGDAATASLSLRLETPEGQVIEIPAQAAVERAGG